MFSCFVVSHRRLPFSASLFSVSLSVLLRLPYNTSLDFTRLADIKHSEHEHMLTRWTEATGDCCSLCSSFEYKVSYCCFGYCGFVVCAGCFGEPPPFYQFEDYLKEFSTHCADAIKRCESDEMKNEQFVPSLLLHGLVPSALLDTHDFWQDAEDNLRGYPHGHPPEDAPHIIFIELKAGITMASQQQTGCVAKITRKPKKAEHQTKTSGEEEEMVLLNLLYAPEGTPLFAVTDG